MKISLRCTCGATFDGEAEKGALQTADLNALLREWMAAHSDHAYLPSPQEPTQ